jgi:hypothetical protein
MVTQFEKIHTIGVHEQLALMRLVHPEFQSTVRDGALCCRGTIQPTPLNQAYQVRVEYRAPEAPLAYVDDPQLRRRDPKERIPHTYEGDRPCLYLPGVNEWRSDKRIAETIIPWLSEWLFYYEVWRATGEWLGGGVHPTPRAGRRRREDAE